MKIGLIRHFKVKHPFPKKILVSAADAINWFEEYEVAELEIINVDLGSIEWQMCYTSPLKRATRTASHIFPGDIVIVPDRKSTRLNSSHLVISYAVFCF